ncbi:MAG TPA: UbiA family prenyltransferase [Actinophytocola sp.]|uniref:SCO3242 family prenyltransferase n=1 Tax=Actinophytocola sp. TaxID=1872138 RepID=UPI002DBDF763|nr:UbiA family prenyltransferase [Actinophytocola sp.]HEU5472437.1 UbiA family prenyltransferase [Actinophytocola sp.]
MVRAPAALSVPGDSLAGAAAAGWPFGARSAIVPAATVCLYWAGMALNDWADRELDRVERPERPIPSGRVSPRFALGLAAGLTAAGVGLAGLAGGRAGLRVAVPLAGTVWAYDLALKSTPAGPVAMAAARALDVLLGAGGGRAAIPAAVAVGTHTLGVTLLSRGEVHGMTTAVPKATLAITVAITGAALTPGRRAGRFARLAAAGLAACYAGSVGSAQSAAIRDPTSGPVRRAVGAGILGLMPLQASLLARAGSVRVAVPVALAFPLARRLSRKVAAT